LSGGRSDRNSTGVIAVWEFVEFLLWIGDICSDDPKRRKRAWLGCILLPVTLVVLGVGYVLWCSLTGRKP